MIKKKAIIFTIISLVFIVNTSLVYVASETDIKLPQPIVELVDWLSNFFDSQEIYSFSNKDDLAEHRRNNEIGSPQLSENLNQKHALIKHDKNNTTFKETIHTELQTLGSTCNVVSTLNHSTNIYKWVDDSGITHLSDKPRKINSDSPVEIIGVIEPDLLSVNYLSNEGSLRLKNKIHASVTNAKQFFEKVVPKSLITPVKINFRLFSNISQYKRYQEQVAPRLIPNIGFYMSKNNESVVMIHNENQGIATSVHEAMHSINRHWFGNMSRWINEGIAEYAETTQNSLHKRLDIESRIKVQRLVPLRTLFNAESAEWRSQSHNMYATSYAFVAYLMEENTPLLSRLLMEESINGCKTVNLQDVERIAGARLQSLQRRFNVWVNEIARARQI